MREADATVDLTVLEGVVESRRARGGDVDWPIARAVGSRQSVGRLMFRSYLVLYYVAT